MKLATRLGAYRRRQVETFAHDAGLPFRTAIRELIEAGLGEPPPPQQTVRRHDAEHAGPCRITTKLDAALAEELEEFRARHELATATALRRLVVAALD